METRSRDLYSSSLSDFARAARDEIGQATQLTISLKSLVLDPRLEPVCEDTVAMAREDGVSVLYSREETEDAVIWHRFQCVGRPDAVAWILEELDYHSSRSQGLRGDNPTPAGEALSTV